MGAYLSEPIVEKLSSDELNNFLEVGSSSMQGWRISQEDAHNCVLKYDENTSLFAVYDGHGGAEVATYCADKFPNFLKSLKSYEDKDFEKALKEAFIQFDATLLDDKVVEILKRLAGERNPEQDSDMLDDDDEEDLDELCEEGSLPLEKVLAKYKAKNPSIVSGAVGTTKTKIGLPLLNKLKKDESAGTSKPLSPCLRGRRNIHANESAGGSSSSTSCSSSSSTSTTKNIETDEIKKDIVIDDGVVSSSASILIKNIKNLESSDEIKTNEAAPSNENGSASPIVSESDSLKKISNSPDSSIVVITKENIQNGNTEQPSSVSSSSGVTCSVISSKIENGEITSPSSSVSKTSSNIEKSPLKVGGSSSGISSSMDGDDSTSDSDADFQAEDDSETDDGDEDCEPMIGDDEDTEDDEDEGDEDEEIDEDAYKDEQFCANMVEEPGKDSGCTAVVALLHGRDLYVANAGDSRCVICRDGKAIDMSIDHKPEDEEELVRIAKAGGRVTLDGRVNGGLNLSRAIGDHAYKINSELAPEEQMISAMPDVKKLILHPQDEFMILACDGIWNYMSSEEVVEFVKERIDNGVDKMSKICEELFEMCLSPNTLGDGTGCDNMTAVIIRFKPEIIELPTKIDPNDTITAEQKKMDVDVTLKLTSNSSSVQDDGKPKSKKRSASPTKIESSSDSEKNLNNETGTTTTATHIESNKLEITEPLQKRLKTDEIVDSSVDKVDCSSSSNSCSSNGTAEAAAAAASITVSTNDDIGSTTATTTTPTSITET